MPEDVQKIVRESVGNNAYFFHPENILLSMITDSNRFIRRKAYEKILLLRQELPPQIRTFNPSTFEIKFDCLTYSAMIDWHHFTTEPPLLQFYTQDQLKRFEEAEEIIEIPGKQHVNSNYIYITLKQIIFPIGFLCHSQNNERFVRVVSESALAVTDENRLQHIFSKLESRERYGKLESKMDLV